MNQITNRQSTLNQVMAGIEKEQWRVEQMLPPDLPFERFQANVLNALRSNPSVLDATPKSLIESCMKAAYDGLRIDGREAAIVTRDMTFNRNKPHEQKVTIATYMPMAFGLIQQIYRGGEVVSMFADVIRENDKYQVLRGTAPGIYHEPLLTGERGSIIAAYSVATLKSGAVSYELLDRNDLADIRGAATTKNVWEGWAGEMSKKSAIRRHRKTLPLGDRDIVIRDSEETDVYGLDGKPEEALPMPTQRPAAPTRAQIAQQAGSESGVDMDLEEEGAVIDQEEKPKEKAKPKPKKQASSEPEKMNSRDDAIPEDEAAWRAWSEGLMNEITAAGSQDEVNAIAKREEVRLKVATTERSGFIRGLISDRLTDFAMGEER